eukprot:549780_1
MANIQTVPLQTNYPLRKDQAARPQLNHKEYSGEISPLGVFPGFLDNPHNDEELVTTNLPCNMHDIETKRDDPQYIFPRIPSYTNLSSVSNAFPSHLRCHKLSNVSMCDDDTKQAWFNTTQDANMCCVGKDIDNCIGLQRIVSILSFYSTNYNKSDAITAYLSKYNVRKHLVNDYHHMIDKHLNEHNHSQSKCDKQFELIYAYMMEDKQLFCDIGTCNIWLRNNRERELVPVVSAAPPTPEGDDDKLSMFMDMLDSIHCYFMHSVDIGHRIMIEDDNHNYFDQDLTTCYDARMSFLRRYLGPKKAIQLKKQKQSCRFATNLRDNTKSMAGYLRKESMYLKQLRQRYMVLENGYLSSYKTDKKEELTESIELSRFDHVQMSENGAMLQFEFICEGDYANKRVFIASNMKELDDWLTALKPNMVKKKETKKEMKCFGERYDYWSSASLYPKYESIKEEVTSNNISRISHQAFTAAFNKAIHLRSCHKIRNMMVCKDVTDEYDVRWDATPRIDHILAVVLWTDYRVLSAQFRRTFDKLSKKMYDEFWIWSKFLIESVNAFGERLKKSRNKSCFHVIVNEKKRFLEYESVFNAPTSMTTKLEIAILNAPKNGIILEATNYKKLRYFNCSFVSYFGNENERLFVQPPRMNKSYYFGVSSIRNMVTNENYGEYLGAMRVLDTLLGNNGVGLDVARGSCAQQMNDMISILSGQAKEGMPWRGGEYVMDALCEWSETITRITFDSYSSNKIVPLADIDLFVDSIPMARFDKLNVMFKQLISIHFVMYDVGASCQAVMNESAHYHCIATMLQRINQFKYSQLNEIKIGFRYNKRTVDDKELIFASNWKEFQHVIAAQQWQMIYLEDANALQITRTI